MCLHVLRYSHTHCPHLSPVPPELPHYIPPRKCKAVLDALEYYHSQPYRAPEMYPPPSPNTCPAYYGNTDCKGNVQVVLRDGKCDSCNRTIELGIYAKELRSDLRMCAPEAKQASRHEVILKIGKPKTSEEYERKFEILTEMGDHLVAHREFFSEDSLVRVIVRIMTEGRKLHIPGHTWFFWMLFSQYFAEKLTGPERYRLGGALYSFGEYAIRQPPVSQQLLNAQHAWNGDLLTGPNPFGPPKYFHQLVTSSSVGTSQSHGFGGVMHSNDPSKAPQQFTPASVDVPNQAAASDAGISQRRSSGASNAFIQQTRTYVDRRLARQNAAPADKGKGKKHEPGSVGDVTDHFNHISLSDSEFIVGADKPSFKLTMEAATKVSRKIHDSLLEKDDRKW